MQDISSDLFDAITEVFVDSGIAKMVFIDKYHFILYPLLEDQEKEYHINIYKNYNKAYILNKYDELIDYFDSVKSIISFLYVELIK